MGSFGWQEALIILGVLTILFGAKRIPELGRSIGLGIAGFRAALRSDSSEEGSPDSDDAQRGHRAKVR